MKKIQLLALLLLVFLAACTPAATPTSAPVPTADDASFSPAVATVDMFYTLINVAQSSEELGTPWYILTPEEQCNPLYNCETTNFQTNWWQSHVVYRLYNCGPTTVIAEELRYPRSGSRPSTMTGSKYWNYALVDDSGLLMVSKVSATKAPGSECILALDRLANP